VSGRVIEPPDPRPDPAVRANLHRAAASWEAGRARAHELVDWETWRDRAQAIRADAVANLPELVDRLEQRVIEVGGHVHRAATAAQANAVVTEICAAAGASMVVKGKSMTTEETGLGEALAAAEITAIETDLGEYVVQQLGQRPSHILAPAVHLSAAQIAELFGRLAGHSFDPDDTRALVAYARGALRERFLEAQVGITGVNFAVAESGTLAIVESEGNVRLCSSLPRVHIAVMGIEKVVRDWAGAAHLVGMVSLAAHGKPAPASTSFVTGPARGGDDGPGELHLVLLDDGRSALRGTELESALHCIRCGACLYACPVYRQMGGHRYGSVYTGPIGAVITPALEGSGAEGSKLAELSSLCGACVEACPVKIPLDDQLVALRAAARERDPRRAEAAVFGAWSRLWSRPGGYRASAATSGRALGPLWRRALRAEPHGWAPRAPFPFAGWTAERDVRLPAARPFHRRWRERRGG